MELFLGGLAAGAVFASVAGFKAGSFFQRLRTKEEHIVLVAQNTAYEKILNVSTIRREIK